VQLFFANLVSIPSTEGSEGYTPLVQEDTGERLVLRFEIAIVKIPLFNLHGIQFKKVQGGMNQYRSMTSTILNSLRL